jgi:hypothetical protein
MGAVKTAGRGAVAPVGLPSAEAIETVGRDAIVVDGEVGRVVVLRGCGSKFFSRSPGGIFRLVR